MKGFAFFVFSIVSASVVMADTNGWPFAILRSYGSYEANPKFTEQVFAAQARHAGLFNEIWFGGDGGLDFTAKERGENALKSNLGIRERCHALGIQFSYQQGYTLGHNADMIRRKHVPEDACVVDSAGVRRHGLLCCTSQWTRDYLRETAKEIISRIKPDSFWPDDDLRLCKDNWRRPTICFCPRCLELFSKKVGRKFTREGLMDELVGKKPSAAIRRAWSEFNGEQLGEFAKVYREAVDAVSPKTRLGFQIALSGNVIDGESWRTILEALAGRNGKAGIRPGGLYYMDSKPRELAEKLVMVARESARCGKLPVIGQRCYETENWPHIGAQKNANGQMAECAAALAVGCDSIAFYWGADQNGESADTYDFWLETVAAWRPFHLAVRDAFLNTSLGGIAAYHGSNFFATNGWIWHEEGEMSAIVDMAFPITVTEASPDAYFLNERCVSALGEDDLQKVFSRPVVMSVASFQALARQFPKLGFTKKVRIAGVGRELSLVTTKRTNGYEMFASGLKCANVKALVYPESKDVLTFSKMTVDESACGTCVIPTEFGGKVVLVQEFPNHGPHYGIPGCRRHGMYDALDAATPGKFPVRLLTDGYAIAVWVRKTADGRTAGVFLHNLGLGETQPLELAIRRGASGKWTLSRPKRDDLTAKVIRSAVDEVVLAIPPMGAFETILVH